MLKGSLEHFALADIFRLLSWAKKTGKIEVARSVGQGKVFFRDGEVYYAESSLSREPLGQKLIRSGMLTEANLRRALEQNTRSGEMIGQILLSNGWVTEHQLQTALKQQIEDSVFDMLSSKEGTFAFSPGVVADIDVEISVSVENLIMEASRRLDEMELIRRKIPSLDTVLRMSSKPPEGAAEINITAEEWRMLVLVDGERSITEIAQAVGKDSFGTLRALYGLVNSGLVEVVPEEDNGQQVFSVEPAISISPEPPRVAPGPVGPLVERTMFDEPAESDKPVDAPAAQVPGSPVGVEPTAAEEPQQDVPESPVTIDIDADAPDAESDSPVGSDELAGPPDLQVLPGGSGAPVVPPAPRGRVLYGDSGPIFEPDPEPEPSEQEAEAEPPSPAEQPGLPARDPEPARPPIDPQVDRSTVVRELAGLFSDEDSAPAEPRNGSPDNRKRVEDDEAVDRKLISKLIDGVKGL